MKLLNSMEPVEPHMHLSQWTRLSVSVALLEMGLFDPGPLVFSAVYNISCHDTLPGPGPLMLG